MRYPRSILCFAAVFAFILAVRFTTVATAMIDSGVSDGHKGFAWFPQSHGRPGPHQHPRDGDPITLIFRGGGIQPYNAVADYIQYDWDPGYPLPNGLPPSGVWATHTTFDPCLSQDFLTFRWAGTAAQTVPDSFTGSTSGTCLFNQYHGRFWSDSVHGFQSGQGYENWVVGSVHHDHFVIHRAHHHLDVPWDLARVVFIHAMHRHCSQRIWHVNLGARMTYQGFINSGRISRISRYTGRPCNGQ